MLTRSDDPRYDVPETTNMMTKQDILTLGKEIAKENGGRPPGAKLLRAHGVTTYAWRRHWRLISDFQREAGFAPNRLKIAISSDTVVRKWIELARELHKAPGSHDLQWKRLQDPLFPDERVFRRIGATKKELMSKVRAYSECNAGHEDILLLCKEALGTDTNDSWTAGRSENTKSTTVGYVYLLKSGRYYKIGKSNAAGRREYELNVQMPEESKNIHVIRTDDPSGIENYWHKRFETKRKKGEWFDLTASDVQAFKRRKFM